MAKTASNEKKDRGRPWQRAATRTAILAAARRLIGRTGTGNLSLTAVAREADFAPATVFAYFANKNDLFLSVLADDLATFARTMKRAHDSDDGAANDALPADAGAPTVSDQSAPLTAATNRLRLVEKPEDEIDVFALGANELESQRDIATVLLQELSPPTAVSLPTADIDAFAMRPDELATQEDIASELLRELSPAVEDLVAQDAGRRSGEPAYLGPDIAQELARLQEAVAKLETRPVDQWLERRLREFERGLTALEARPEKAEAAAALAAMDDYLRRLNTRVETIEKRQTQAADDVARTMRERGEQIDKRLRDFLSDIDAANVRTVKRLDALENAAFATAPEFFQAGIHNAPAGPAVAAVTRLLDIEPAKVNAPEPVAENAVVPKPEKSFLSAARQSALAASEEVERKVSPAARPNRLSKRALYMIATGLGLVVALIWAGVFVKALAVPAAKNLPARALLVAQEQKLALKPDPQAELLTLAQRGNAKAELVVALDLLSGPRKNDALAVRWLDSAARRGDAFSAFKLATLYRAGRGVAVNPVLAFRWFEVAAHKGNCKAMQNLAVAFAEGWGTQKNEQEAARWFTRAASFGLTDAQFNLGVLYEQGLGVPQSLSDAYKWYLVAAAAGDREAEARVDAIKPQLLSTDLAAAEEAAASFKAAPADQGANVAPAVSQFFAG
jgi:TPR repeat protein